MFLFLEQSLHESRNLSFLQRKNAFKFLSLYKDNDDISIWDYDIYDTEMHNLTLCTSIIIKKRERERERKKNHLVSLQQKLPID